MKTLIRTRHFLDGTYYVHTNENRSHFLYGFSFVGHLVLGEGHSVFREGCDSFALIRVAEGRGQLVAGDRTYFLTEGQLAFYDQMEPCRFSAVDAFPLVVDCVYLYGPNLRQMYNRFYGEYGNLLPHYDGELFARTTSELYHGRADAYTISAAVYELLMDLMRYCKEGEPTGVGLAVEFIRDHFSEDIKLDDMARAAYLSKYYFLRKFKEYTGMTPKEYLEEVRFEQSKQFLNDAQLSVEEVACAVGCKDARTLVALFRERTGVTPSVYRKYALENLKEP